MKKYTYLPPKVKHSTKLVDVIDEAGNKIFTFKRNYKNILTRMTTYVWDIDWNVQIDVYSNDRNIVYQCIKNKWLGKPTYKVINCLTSEEYEVSYISWQVISPELLIKSEYCEFIVKKAPMDWAKFYYQGKEVARWRMKTLEWFKTYLEIEEDSPIQEPEFFTSIAQTLFYIGE
ncbi:tubby C-terminal domain-like protein [Bacillus proteolyticus]|uniref:tubby C-terminal domain-like protein n=1 Tax=Bacillus proteolyticus TaxID=2026192 RepID=UPI0030F42531